MDSKRWIDPVMTEPADDRPLSGAAVHAWRTHGAAVVQDLLPTALIEATASHARDHYGVAPAAGSTGAFGSGGQMVFPADSGFVNEITLHPRMLAAVSQLLECPVRDVRLSQSDLWAKWGRERPVDDQYDNNDQRMHVDYPNHMLTHPPAWDQPDAVEMIVYMDDVASCGGATAVVRRSGPDDPAYPYPIVATPGVGEFDWINDRVRAEQLVAEAAPEVATWRQEQLYDREEHVRFRPGTVLLYRHDTWHRGTPIDPGALRVVHNLTFRRAASEWISTLHQGWSWAAYRRSQVLERLIATASVDQRCVLGFPAPGHPFWTADTIAAVQARYSRFDIDLSEYATG